MNPQSPPIAIQSTPRSCQRESGPEAEILLQLHPGLSIGEIAFKCGFADSNYFSAVFRRERGMPPTAFRQRKPVR